MGKQLKVLIVDDSPADAKLIAQALRKGRQPIEWERVEDAPAMKYALTNERWDVVISDWTMPKFSAPAALRILRDMGLDVPFIIVSGAIGEEFVVEAMRAGANDYVLKDRLGRLAPAVEREVREGKARNSRRAAEQSLRASERRFAHLYESGIVGVSIGDMFGRILEASDACLKILGYTRDDLESGSFGWAQITPPEWKAADALALARLEADGVATPWEKELVHKNGVRVPVLLGVAALDYPNVIAFMVDLTDRKLAEGAAGIAQDFNNILTVIQSHGNMLRAEMSNEDPMRGDLDETDIASERGANLTHQLLAYSRQQVLQPRLVDLNDVVHRMVEMLRQLIGDAIELVILPASDLGRVMVQHGKVELVIMNLVVNSRDAMPHGGKLTIATSDVVLDEQSAAENPGAIAGPNIMITVGDSGRGMNEATRARMFDPFFTTKGPSTGLGLSIVSGIVKENGGAIVVRSSPEQGTVIKIYFPKAARCLFIRVSVY